MTPKMITFSSISMMESNVNQTKLRQFIDLADEITTDLLHQGYWSDHREIITFLWYMMEIECKKWNVASPDERGPHTDPEPEARS